MSSPPQPVHIVFFPLLAQGHMIPMVDMARIFASRGAVATIYTTPVNAHRFRTTVNQSGKLGMLIRLVEIPFPCEEVGLPVGYENLDILPSPELLNKFYDALGKLQEPIEKHLREQTPAPSCIISDKYIFWSSETAQRFGVPRFVFHAFSCFSMLTAHNAKHFSCSDSITSDLEPFELPGMPKELKITKAQLPGNSVRRQDFDIFRGKIREAEMAAQGVVFNSFDEVEHGCIEAYQKAIGKRVWCVGPVSLCNKDESDMFQRGNKASSDADKCMAWLDSMKPRSVIYACLGSLCRLVPSQLMELGRGLGASQQPFVWVIKRGEGDSELEKLLEEERFEERVKGRGMVIRGWAPQVAVLSHRAIGGFLTHCGWNSTLEGVCSALPMITWPLFSDQFVNEAVVVDILKIGVRVGVKVPVRWGEERKVGVMVKEDEIVRAINALVSEDEEGEERRNRAAELGEKARQASRREDLLTRMCRECCSTLWKDQRRKSFDAII